MAEQVLEVGPGWCNALWEPGTTFSTSYSHEYETEVAEIDYVGLDIRGMPGRTKFMQKEPVFLPGVRSALHEAPFPDDSFDLVLMQSVLGDYSIRLADGFSESEATGIYSTLTFDVTFIDGLAKVFDLLKSQGRLVISEEDTPVSSRRVVERLAQIGFTGMHITPFSQASFTDRYVWQKSRVNYHTPLRHTQPDEDWMRARGAYWRTELLGDDSYLGQQVNSAAQNYPDTAYVLAAYKPAR